MNKNVIKKSNTYFYNNIIFYKLEKFNGNIFYSYEYAKYLQSTDFILFIYLEKIKKEHLIKLWNLKYENIDLSNIIFLNHNEFVVSKKCLILDCTSIKYFNNKIMSQKLIYNYGNDLKSINKEFNDIKSNNIIIGDKDIGCKVQYHYPTMLNFSIFKKFKEFNNSTYIESKTTINNEPYENQTVIKRYNKKFKQHNEFNKYGFYKVNCFDRANRLIPECKYYNKKIKVINRDSFIDSVTIRYKEPFQKVDLNNFVSSDTKLSLEKFIKEI